MIGGRLLLNKCLVDEEARLGLANVDSFRLLGKELFFGFGCCLWQENRSLEPRASFIITWPHLLRSNLFEPS